MSRPGLLAAFREFRPRNLSDEMREAILAYADEYEAALRRFFLDLKQAALEKVALHSFAEDTITINGIDIAISSYVPNPGTLAELISGSHGEFGSKAPSQDWQSLTGQIWGEHLFKGIASKYGDIIESSVMGSMAHDSIESAAKSIEYLSNKELSASRARLIAQSEAIRTYNAMNRESIISGGFEFVQWLDGQAGACPSCKALHEKVIPIGPHQMKFANLFIDPIRGLMAAHPPLHPGCRCTIIAYSEADEPQFQAPYYHQVTQSIQPGTGMIEFAPLPDIKEVFAPKKATTAALTPPGTAVIDLADRPWNGRELSVTEWENMSIEYRKLLTIDQREALGVYSSSQGIHIQRALRNPDNPFLANHSLAKVHIPQIDAAFRQFQLKEDLLLFRGMHMTEEAYEEMLAKGSIQDLAYSSASINSEVANSYAVGVYSKKPINVVLNVKIRAGEFVAPMHDITNYEWEQEILLDREAVFHITGEPYWDKDLNIWIIPVEYDAAIITAQGLIDLLFTKE